MENNKEVEEIVKEAYASTNPSEMDDYDKIINNYKPYFEKAKIIAPDMDIKDFLLKVYSLVAQEHNLPLDLEKIMPTINEVIDDLFKHLDKSSADEINSEFILDFIEPYHKKIEQHCGEIKYFQSLVVQGYKMRYLQPKNDLMSVIKEWNSNLRTILDEHKLKNTEFNPNNDEFFSLLKPYHERVKVECPDIKYFFELCSLDFKYNFIGGAVLNKEGSTTVSIK